MITVELEPKLEHSVQHTAKILDMTVSELIHESLSEYLGKLSKPSPSFLVMIQKLLYCA